MAVELYIVVEGDTEERFANQVLTPHLADRGVWAHVSKVITRGRRGRARKDKGGGRLYRAWKRDLTDWIKQQGHRPDVWFTTMLDLYGLGAFSDGFPGYVSAEALPDPYRRAEAIQRAWAQDIGFARFVPHLQLHEFESLLLVDVAVLKALFIDDANGVDALAAEIAAVGKPPEQINDGPRTSPSHRIVRHVPRYGRRKADAGPSAAAAIGLPRLRKACPHFDAWLLRLESLPTASASC